MNKCGQAILDAYSAAVSSRILKADGILHLKSTPHAKPSPPAEGFIFRAKIVSTDLWLIDPSPWAI